ncbi:hypothetical protein Pyn_20187 [Prunus yedoensis var. nudiflora]|uniref:Uncharacterized protein n=1 Tax=Prunus yedoensis var. nudiflora TaxID=2094558 RepID=A0A314YRH6_PRUYE|nr:hypothetical protein Pyn_20187 [Prunus yedoensis var. nudiflora]
MERLRAKEGGFEEEDGGSERSLEGEKKKRRNGVGEGNGKGREPDGGGNRGERKIPGKRENLGGGVSESVKSTSQSCGKLNTDKLN